MVPNSWLLSLWAWIIIHFCASIITCLRRRRRGSSSSSSSLASSQMFPRFCFGRWLIFHFFLAMLLLDGRHSSCCRTRYGVLGRRRELPRFLQRFFDDDGSCLCSTVPTVGLWVLTCHIVLHARSRKNRVSISTTMTGCQKDTAGHFVMAVQEYVGISEYFGIIYRTPIFWMGIVGEFPNTWELSTESNLSIKITWIIRNIGSNIYEYLGIIYRTSIISMLFLWEFPNTWELSTERRIEQLKRIVYFTLLQLGLRATKKPTTNVT